MIADIYIMHIFIYMFIYIFIYKSTSIIMSLSVAEVKRKRNLHLKKSNQKYCCYQRLWKPLEMAELWKERFTLSSKFPQKCSLSKDLPPLFLIEFYNPKRICSVIWQDDVIIFCIIWDTIYEESYAVFHDEKVDDKWVTGNDHSWNLERVKNFN